MCGNKIKKMIKKLKESNIDMCMQLTMLVIFFTENDLIENFFKS